jgi:single-strand DNA-binding protein
MNQFVIECAALGVFQSGLTQNQTTTAEGEVTIAGLGEDAPDETIQVTAYGKAADALLTCADGQPLRLHGSMSIQKDPNPEIKEARRLFTAEKVCILDNLSRQELNSVILIGRAGRDPEARYFESGSVVANFSLAVNRRSRDDEPDWFNLEIWGKQAQVAADYVRKGGLIAVAGSFRVEHWTDRASGEERSKPVIRVDRLELLGSRRDNQEGVEGAADRPAPTARPANQPRQAQAPAAPAAPARPARTRGPL